MSRTTQDSRTSLARIWVNATIAAPLAIVLFWSCGFAQKSPNPTEDSFSYGAETDFNSGYIWHGLLVNDAPSVQPSAWVSMSGFTFAVWTSIPLTKTSDREQLNANFLSLTYGRNWKKLTIEPSIETYLNRRSAASDDPNTIEVSLKLSLPAGPFQVFTTHSFDALAYRGAYFGEAGVSYERHLNKKTELAFSFYSGWASREFNDVYIGVRKPAFNLIGADASLSYYLTPYLYFRPHFEFNRIADRRLRQYLDTPTVINSGLALGFEF